MGRTVQRILTSYPKKYTFLGKFIFFTQKGKRGKFHVVLRFMNWGRKKDFKASSLYIDMGAILDGK